MPTTAEGDFWGASDPPEWPEFTTDMNGDGLYTVSDLLLQAEWVMFLPGNVVVKLLLTEEKAIGTFLEIDPSWYFGWASSAFSGLGWLLLVLAWGWLLLAWDRLRKKFD